MGSSFWVRDLGTERGMASNASGALGVSAFCGRYEAFWSQVLGVCGGLDSGAFWGL